MVLSLQTLKSLQIFKYRYHHHDDHHYFITNLIEKNKNKNCYMFNALNYFLIYYKA
jgi:hypothetical protein